MSLSPELLQVWLAAVDEGYASAAALDALALREIELVADVPPWLIDLYEATSKEAARNALSDALRVAGARPLYFPAVRLGIVWLAFERGYVSFGDALFRAGAIADRADADSKRGVAECEAFYALLTSVEIEEEHAAVSYDSIARARDLFASGAEIVLPYADAMLTPPWLK